MGGFRGGFRLSADAKLICHPERYMDGRGERMWETVWRLIGRVPWDYIPLRSYPLFQAREALRTLSDELRATKRPLPTPSPTGRGS